MDNIKKILIRGGTIVTLDEKRHVYEHADLLITGEQITAIGKAIETDDAEIIDASHMVVMPGFIDSHRHTWESVLRGEAANYSLMEYLQHILGTFAPVFRAEDLYMANLLGALEAIDNGITTIMDWCHVINSPDHADAAINGLKDAGIRAVFGYGTPGTSVWEWFYESARPHPVDIERVLSTHFSSNAQLVTPALAIRGPEYSEFPIAVQDIGLARRLNLPISMHVGCGVFAGKYQAIRRLAAADLLGPDINFAHGNFLSGDDLRLLADNGCSISITPEVEMQMGLGFPATAAAIEAGLAPSLGVDVVTAAGGDMFTQMRIGLQTARALSNQQVLSAGEMPNAVTLKVSDALEWATVNGARALQLDRKTGSLTPGKQADILLLRNDLLTVAGAKDPVSAIVTQASAANIDSVFVAGRLVKKGGQLTGFDLAVLRKKAAATARFIYEKALASSIASA